MTPSEITELRDMLRGVEAKLDTSMQLGKQAEQHQAQELSEIKSQVQVTNGRVSGLEDWRQRAVGAAWAFALVWTATLAAAGVYIALK